MVQQHVSIGNKTATNVSNHGRPEPELVSRFGKCVGFTNRVRNKNVSSFHPKITTGLTTAYRTTTLRTTTRKNVDAIALQTILASRVRSKAT